MYISIKLYRQVEFWAVEIHNIPPDTKLPAESKSMELIIFYELPKSPFGRRGSMTKFFANEFMRTEII